MKHRVTMMPVVHGINKFETIDLDYQEFDVETDMSLPDDTDDEIVAGLVDDQHSLPDHEEILGYTLDVDWDVIEWKVIK